MFEIEEMSMDDLEKNIKFHERILNETQLKIKEIKPAKKKKMLKKAFTFLLITGGVTLLNKAIGFGYPFYKEDIKRNLVITSEIDMNGNEEEISHEYSAINTGGLFSLNYNYNEVLSCYNYSDYTNNGVEENIRYVEKYDIANITQEEALKMLADANIDLESIFGSPEITKVKEVLNKKNGLKLVKEKVIKEKYIEEKEPWIFNLASSIAWSVEVLVFLALDRLINQSSQLAKLEIEEQKEEELIRKLKLERDKRK